MESLLVGGDHIPRERKVPGAARKRHATTRFACPHVLQVWTWGPHPRYGDRVPFCVPSLIPHPSCGC